VCFSEFRDPTQPPGLPEKSVASVIPDDTKLHLSAILTSSLSKRVIINGVMAKQGQTILNNVKILKIRKNSVDIMQQNKPKTLVLLKRTYTIPK
jgi:hypothetical protein